jgi:hypothetical protein
LIAFAEAVAGGGDLRKAPSLPEQLEHIWEDFSELKKTKLAGLAGQQITWVEINAYSDAHPAGLTFWQKRLIRRLDDAYENARHGTSKKPQQSSVADMRATLRAALAGRKGGKKHQGSPSE